MRLVSEQSEADVGRHRAQEQLAPGEHARPETVTLPHKASGCNIKGNISAGGERIYHLP
jgi:hypothetical protein